MEFIEACDDIQKKLSLTCLSQLVENPKTVPYFDDWNSIRTMRNSTQLLVKLYEDEEIKCKVEYKEGVLQNTERPLNPIIVDIEKTKKQLLIKEDSKDEIEVTDVKPITSPNLAASKGPGNNRLDTIKGFSKLKDALNANETVSEVGAEAYLIRMLREKTKKFDLRGIIFSILYRTGFDRNELQPSEKQRIEMINIYPQLRIGEIWTDIKEELEAMVIRPSNVRGSSPRAKTCTGC